jgi:hypothetical protein
MTLSEPGASLGQSTGRMATRLIVRTTRTFSHSAHIVWPLLCNSKMDRSSTVLFKLGVPQPIECLLPEGHGGVGSERECVSDQGVVHQRILVWVPEKKLSFRMEKSNLESAKSVTEIQDTFNLVPIDRGVRVTRITEASVVGRYRSLKKIALFFALKHVHRYVFGNWQRLAEETGSQLPPDSGRRIRSVPSDRPQ